jgi:hypothetical protein
VIDVGAPVGLPAPRRGYAVAQSDEGADQMLWLVLGTILLILALAGGAIVNPILFVLALVALFMFFSGWRGSGRTI